MFKYLLSLMSFCSVYSYGEILNLNDIEYNKTKNVIILSFERKPLRDESHSLTVCEILLGNLIAHRTTTGEHVVNLYQLNPTTIQVTEYEGESERSFILKGNIEVSESPKAHIWRFRANHQGKIFMLNLSSTVPNPTLSQISANAGTL